MLLLKRGTFIVVEGCDRSGKTTQCKRLVDELNKLQIPAQYVNFPDRSTPIGGILQDYLQKKNDLSDKAVHLLFSANRWEAESKMWSLLQNGTSLIVDRYSFSGVAFSLAKPNMDINWCWQPEVGLPEPDAVFLLNLSSEAIARRGGFGDERYELSDFQKKVWENFSLMQNETWREIDADTDQDTLHSVLLKSFIDVHSSSQSSPLKSFTSDYLKKTEK